METLCAKEEVEKEPLRATIELLESVPAIAVGSEVKVTIVGKLTYIEQGSRYPGDEKYRKAKGELRIEPSSIKVSESQESAMAELLEDDD